MNYLTKKKFELKLRTNLRNLNSSQLKTKPVREGKHQRFVLIIHIECLLNEMKAAEGDDEDDLEEFPDGNDKDYLLGEIEDLKGMVFK